ncbi:N-acetylmuramoyl-L-alanine amidase [Terrabacter sp. NPDC000476]|uniref:peptidoglycan recognition protein family protein n=1 Tax=Terrabacter sp. NPDC000476 TaxID=3154258 RepID=UPI00331EC3D6
MATALTADAMLAALAKWGIEPRFYKSDWRTHHRTAQQGFGPINGFVVHNFGSDTSDPNSLAYLYNGDLARGMPGPLSQFSITDDGTVWIIGWGTANHTGFLDKDLHALVLNDAAPLDKDFRPNASGSSGTGSGTNRPNVHYLGVEMTYGKKPTAAQRRSVVLLGAALMDALGPGYTGGSVVGHREATSQRSDPVGIPMWELRQEINALLKAGPGRAASGGTGTPAPKPSPVPEEDPMAGITLSEIGDQIWNKTQWTGADGKVYSAASWLKAGNEKAGRAESLSKQALARVAALEATVGVLAAAQGQSSDVVLDEIRKALANIRIEVTAEPTA